MKQSKGFSLIELLIVVAIILIIAAIAVPNLLRSRMAANEASAAASERTLATSNVTYLTTYGIGFAPTLASLGPAAAASSGTADLIDATLSAGTKSGFKFTYSAPNATPVASSPNNSYTSVATPSTANSTGVSHFCVDQTNVVGKDPSGTAAAATAGVACESGTGTPFPVL